MAKKQKRKLPWVTLPMPKKRRPTVKQRALRQLQNRQNDFERMPSEKRLDKNDIDVSSGWPRLTISLLIPIDDPMPSGPRLFDRAWLMWYLAHNTDIQVESVKLSAGALW